MIAGTRSICCEMPSASRHRTAVLLVTLGYLQSVFMGRHDDLQMAISVQISLHAGFCEQSLHLTHLLLYSRGQGRRQLFDTQHLTTRGAGRSSSLSLSPSNCSDSCNVTWYLRYVSTNDAFGCANQQACTASIDQRPTTPCGRRSCLRVVDRGTKLKMKL